METDVGKILDKHLKMIDELKLVKTLKRVLLIKTAVTAGLFSGEPLTNIVKQVAKKLGTSESTIWKVIKFDKAYTQIQNDYMEVFQYVKQEMMKKMLKGGDSNSITQGPSLSGSLTPKERISSNS